jgi:eukaryotic-like serine/threonine-protein kinase
MWNLNTGNPVVIMDYYPYTLKNYVQEKDLDSQELINLFYQIAQGLAVLHENKYIHRDIKPDNILVSADGKIKIIDFGESTLL